MRIIYSLIFLGIFLVGAFIGIKTNARSKAIFWGSEQRIIVAIVIAALSGLSLSLIAFGAVYFYFSITDTIYPLEIIWLLKSFAGFLIPGFVVFLGSLWQYFTVGFYRDRFLKVILSRRDDKNQK